jgi:hypothetical protein
MIYDRSTNMIKAGWDFDLTLDDVEAWLTWSPRRSDLRRLGPPEHYRARHLSTRSRCRSQGFHGTEHDVVGMVLLRLLK